MSYILEALKKAQAERQLGNAPDIHTPAPIPPPAAAPLAGRKTWLWGLGAGLLIAAAIHGFTLLRAPQAPDGKTVVAQAAKPSSAPVPAPPPPEDTVPVAAAAAVAPAAPPVAAEARSEPPPAAAPAEAPVRSEPEKPAAPARTKAAADAPAAAPVRDSVPEAVYLPAPAAEAPVARAPEPPIEENLRTLQQLPEAIQRDVPKVTFGGYIYSPNPAERLLLVDKVLRREGEELAPGLVLERLLPKYAVMNFRGTRYRVGY